MSRLRARFPFFYRFAVFLALFAMLVPIGTMLTHQPEIAQKFIHICSLHPGKILDQQSGKNTSHKIPSCPLCAGLHALGHGFAPSPLTVLHFASLSSDILIVPTEAASVRPEISPQARPRAPPAFS